MRGEITSDFDALLKLDNKIIEYCHDEMVVWKYHSVSNNKDHVCTGDILLPIALSDIAMPQYIQCTYLKY